MEVMYSAPHPIYTVDVCACVYDCSGLWTRVNLRGCPANKEEKEREDGETQLSAVWTEA